MLKGKSPLPRPKQNVTVIKRLDDSLHIYFNNQELKFCSLKGKPGKKAYKIIKPAKDHPWRKMNNRLPGSLSKKSFSSAALG